MTTNAAQDFFEWAQTTAVRASQWQEIHWTLPRRPSPRERTAVHEAGHPVAAHVLRRRILTVSIILELDTLGRCTHDTLARFQPDVYRDRRTRQQLEREIIIALAGVVAEAFLSGDRHNWRQAEGDVRFASDCALYAADGNPKGAELYVKWLRWKTESLLASPLPWVSAQHVAAALLQHRELSGRHREPTGIHRLRVPRVCAAVCGVVWPLDVDLP